MAKWEYCKLVWQTRVTADKEEVAALAQSDQTLTIQKVGQEYLVMGGALIFLNPFQSEDPEPILSLSSAIPQLGLEGWELVSHSVAAPPDGWETFYFKRPVEDD